MDFRRWKGDAPEAPSVLLITDHPSPRRRPSAGSRPRSDSEATRSAFDAAVGRRDPGRRRSGSRHDRRPPTGGGRDHADRPAGSRRLARGRRRHRGFKSGLRRRLRVAGDCQHLSTSLSRPPPPPSNSDAYGAFLGAFCPIPTRPCFISCPDRRLCVPFALLRLCHRLMAFLCVDSLRSGRKSL